jgi:hypothetical protein
MNYTFVFDSYDLEPDNKLVFRYSYLDENEAKLRSFAEAFRLPVAINADDVATANIMRHLHIIIGISYYKSLLGEVRLPYQISETEAQYYNTIYDNGLGEYAFINKYTEPIQPFSASNSHSPSPIGLKNKGAILGVGGGKDSIVAGEIFKGIQLPTTTMDMATRDHHGQAGAVMDIMGLPQLRIERYVDTAIKEFTDQHQGMHGHIPLSTILAWIGVLLAASTSKRFVAMANEAGTSTGNVEWNGREVNHQWAKSFEHEKLTQEFIRTHVSPDLWYFSPIRPYSSLAIMELLANVGKPYLQDFTSCNLVLRIDPAARPNGRWCTRCAKCLSSWLLLSYWLSTEELQNIFGRNLWEDMSLKPTLKALLGLEGHKPLDCVGTIEELRAVTRKMLSKDNTLPLLEGIHPEDIPGPEINELIHGRNEANIPPELADKIDTFVEGLL